MVARLQQLISRVSAFLRPDALDRDFNEELESHLTMLVEDYLGRGMSPEQALRKARLDLGERAQLVEAHRAARGLPLLDTILRDLQHGLRVLHRNPRFTLTAMLILIGLFGLRLHGRQHRRAAVIALSAAVITRCVAAHRAGGPRQVASPSAF
jgi:hypothetical protein